MVVDERQQQVKAKTPTTPTSSNGSACLRHFPLPSSSSFSVPSAKHWHLLAHIHTHASTRTHFGSRFMSVRIGTYRLQDCRVSNMTLCPRRILTQSRFVDMNPLFLPYPCTPARLLLEHRTASVRPLHQIFVRSDAFAPAHAHFLGEDSDRMEGFVCRYLAVVAWRKWSSWRASALLAGVDAYWEWGRVVLGEQTTSAGSSMG